MKSSEQSKTIEDEFVVSIPTVSPLLLTAKICCGVFLIPLILNLALNLKLLLFILAFAVFSITVLTLHNKIPSIGVHKDNICYRGITIMYKDIESIVCKKKKIKVVSKGKVVAKAELGFNNADKFLSWAEEKQIPIQF